MKRIAVFCGAFIGEPETYQKCLQEIAEGLVAHQIELVYGGGTVGVMGQLAKSMLERGGKVIGVIPHFLVKKEVKNSSITELHLVNSMGERKDLMEKLSDGFVTIPGGVGTLDEFFEMFTLAKLGLHRKPCGILNVNNFYDKLIELLQELVTKGFLDKTSYEMILIEKNFSSLLQRFFEYRSPIIKFKNEITEVS